MRRRPARLQAAVEASCATDLALALPPAAAPAPAPEVAGVLGPGQGEAAGHSAAAGGGDAEAGPGAGGSVRRLETHVWSARRMAMERRWGHALASHAAGRGRGSRSLLAALRRGAVAHDASYWGCVQVEGHQAELAELLRRTSDPARLSALLGSAEVVSGGAEWQLLLHAPGAFPKAPLAPVKGLFLPLPDPGATGGEGAGEGAAAGGRGMDWEGPAGEAGAGADGSRAGAGADAEGWAPRCALWLWVHAAAFADVWAALHDAAAGRCAASPAEAVAAAGGARAQGLRPLALSLRSRCPDLRRIEVVGTGAGAALARVLRPLAELWPPPSASAASTALAVASGAGGPATPAAAGQGDEAKSEGEAELGARVWSSACGGASSSGGGGGGWRWVWPEGCAVGLVAADPRLAAPVAVGTARASALAAAAAGVAGLAGSGAGGGSAGGPGAEAGAGGGADVSGDAAGGERSGWRRLSTEQLRRMLSRWPESGDWTAGASALWRGGPCGPKPPLPGAVVDAARSAARSQLLCGTAGPSASSVTRAQAADTARGGGPGGLQGEAPEAAQAGPAGEGSGSGALGFPVLLLRRCGPSRAASGAGGGGNGGGGGAAAETGGWSVVLPAGWVMRVWLALAFTGVKTAGQVEWRWIAAHLGTPSFPHDHPHTPAGAAHAAQLRAEAEAEAQRRPLGRARLGDGSHLVQLGRLGQAVDLSQPLLLPAALRGKAPQRQRQAAAAQQAAPPVTAATSTAPELAATATDQAGSTPAGAMLGATPESNASWRPALSAAALRTALAASTSADVPVTATASPAAPSVPRKSTLHGWTLRKAIRLGLVAQPPPAQPPPQPIPQDPLPRTTAAGPTVGALARNDGPPKPRWLAHVAVRVQGRGCCESGAEVLANLGVAGGSGPPGAQGARAAVVGYVTSGAPRGSARYPGGMALGDVGALAPLLASGSTLGEVIGAGGRSGNGSALRVGQAFRVWVRNPGSPALRECVARLLAWDAAEALVV
ncbi:hypothetical protein HYH03_018251 [Edaphochlamys debaryana]|uniref:POPLD domain-containing protein n=1 Tax=Edaphochlamys debaryana TaxID=47281 RepID=A0A836BN48_9CHLO|nr:hypothetical protein HYH03_018251 [Edaphochlamys debaryana]|eukprot:KAG2482861.1 hypothetical protein HYH03_018251 [Edaphochlamys debaryana]